MTAASAQSLGTGKSMELAHEELTRVVASGTQVFAFEDPAYPTRLREIYDPPLILYVRSPSDVLSQPGIAVKTSGKTSPATSASRSLHPLLNRIRGKPHLYSRTAAFCRRTRIRF